MYSLDYKTDRKTGSARIEGKEAKREVPQFQAHQAALPKVFLKTRNLFEVKL